MASSCIWCLIVLLVMLVLCQSRDYTDYRSPSEYRTNALRTLKTIKRRVYSTDMIKRSRSNRKKCRRWNEHCVPWTGNSDEACCDSGKHVCSCNLWFHNCRCDTRLWG